MRISRNSLDVPLDPQQEQKVEVEIICEGRVDEREDVEGNERGAASYILPSASMCPMLFILVLELYII